MKLKSKLNSLVNSEKINNVSLCKFNFVLSKIQYENTDNEL